MRRFKSLFDGLEEKIPKKIERKQYLLFLGGVILLSICYLCYEFWDDEPIRRARATPKEKIKLSSMKYGAKGEDRWLNRSEDELAGLKKSINVRIKQEEELQKRINELEGIITKVDEHKTSNISDDRFKALETEIASIKAAATKKSEVNSRGAKRIIAHKMGFKGSKPRAGSGYNTSGFLPIGSHAKAIVISGADASVGVYAQSDPDPVLFKITDFAQSAAHGKTKEVLKTDLRGCVVIGEAFGNLSSERVSVRLKHMTCNFLEGGNIAHQLDIKGFATGVGRSGLRGEVVSREGDLIIKSAVAGAISGIGGGISERYKNPTSILGTGDYPETKNILRSGIGGGVQSSTDKISDYMLKRAEQYQPVIMLPAGTEAELVFLEGVYLDGSGNKK